MINKDNIRSLLRFLNFTEKKGVFSKQYDKSDAYIKVDFNTALGNIIYPKDKGFEIGGDYCCNFTKDEYFVVLELVDYLFEKGYQPNHLVLEPKMEHVVTGRADVLIRDNDKNAWAIIECKTNDTYQNEWDQMQVAPRQLFAYAQVYPSAQYLLLYAANFDDKVVRKSQIIQIKDDKDWVQNYYGDAEVMTYEKAKTQQQKFEAWKNTYKGSSMTKGFFEDRIPIFKVGVDRISIEDLNPVAEEDIQGKYHEFATILRKYNVSGRENAFDRLVNLFLCKIVDETQYSDDLQFYWRSPLYDTYYKLQDRLQNLYKLGMAEFLQEDVVYVEDSVIGNVFKFFANDTNATKAKIEDYFKQLKFYKSNDFSFIDVYNEKLFKKNSEILIKIVEMLQDIRLTTDKPNQFLGDMFEGFLDQGIKQSEGQFFTPLPIVRFILNALPIEEMSKEREIPKVLDYACGAGHFLTEYGMSIGKYVDDDKIEKYYQSLYGVEKEYRLSKIAKVSSFMYGQNQVKIICDDSLKKNTQILDDSFSLIIANPPYSVKGFLETLEIEERKQYELFNQLDINVVTCDNIECFFIERTKQLLKEDGIAAIILPITVLTNKPKIYEKTREIILKFFEIMGIVELGSGAFGKTNTATCVLFLKRRKTTETELADQFEERVNAWYAGDHENDELYGDYSLYEKYCACINVPCSVYKKIIKQIDSEKDFSKYEYIQEYYSEYLNNARYKKLIAKSQYQKLDTDEQKLMMLNDFRQTFVEYEKEKMYYFIMASIKECSLSVKNGNLEYQQQEVVVVRAPKKTHEIKRYLGYEWSSAKNNEGIKYIVNNDKNNNVVKDDSLDEDDKRILKNILNLDCIETPLYDNDFKLNPEKISYYIYSNYIGEVPDRKECIKEYVSCVSLVQLMDFNRTSFNKGIDISMSDQNNIESKYPKQKMRGYVELRGGNTFSRSLQGNTNKKEIPFYKVSDMNADCNQRVMTKANNYISEKDISNINGRIFEKGTIIFPKAGKAIDTNKKRVLGTKALIDNNIMGMTVIKDKCKELLSEYLYYIFETEISLDKFASLANPPSISEDKIYEFCLPIPSINIQKKIIRQCKLIDEANDKCLKEIKRLKKEKEALILSIYKTNTNWIKLGELARINPGKKEIKEYDNDLKVSFVEMASVSENGYIASAILKPLNMAKGYTFFMDNDIILAKISPCMENGKCALVENMNNGMGIGSTEFHVIRATTENNLNKYIFHLLNREIVRSDAAKKMTGRNGHQRVPENFYYDIMIPIPDDKQEIVDIVGLMDEYQSKILECYERINKFPERKKQVVRELLM